MKRLNLGCGKDIKKGFINMDFTPLPGVEVVHNLNRYPWPFKKNEFDYILSSHVLEHLDSIVKPLEEVWRILKPSGRIFVEVPISPGVGAVADPTHRQFYSYFTFDYFRQEDSLNYYSKARFKILSKKIVFHNYFKFFTWFFNLSESMQKTYTLFFSFVIPASSLQVELEAIK